MPTTSRREQHDLRQQHEHAAALKRKADRREAHERRMRQQAEDAARARAERARRHKELKEEEGRRRREKEARRGWGSPGSSSSGSTHSSWSKHNYDAHYYHPESATGENLKWEQERAAVARYEASWEHVKRVAAGVEGELRFIDIPWPSVRPVLSLLDMTPASVESFLLSDALNSGMNQRARLRALILQWHPDKFIGRWLQHVRERDRATVQEGVTTVASIANRLLAKTGH